MNRVFIGTMLGVMLAWSGVPLHPACAESTAEDRAAADALFTEGRDLVAKGEIEAGCERFRQSQARDPKLGTLLYLATCHEQAGKSATALAEFKQALTQAEAENKKERIEQARQGIARVEPTLSKLLLHSAVPVAGLRVHVNGSLVSTLDVALPYDPGEVLIVADAPGRKRHMQKLTLEKGPGTIALSVPELTEDRPNRAVVAPTVESTKDFTLAFAVGGTGIGVTAIGFAFGGVAVATSSSADEHCEGTFCTAEGLDGHDSAADWAWASNMTVAVGLAAVGAGVILLIFAPTVESAPAPAVAILPTVLGTREGGWLPGIVGEF